MKKATIAFFVLFFTILTNGFAQTATATIPAPTAKDSTDFFAGKWAIQFIGIPSGDAKLTTDLVRKDGKLTGKLKPSDGTDDINIASIEETANKMTLSFTAQGYDVVVDLEKVDDDTLKGMLMNMFEAKAARIK